MVTGKIRRDWFSSDKVPVGWESQALEGPSLSQCCLQIERREEPKWALFVDRWESVCQRLDEVIPYGQALAENEADPTR